MWKFCIFYLENFPQYFPCPSPNPFSESKQLIDILQARYLKWLLGRIWFPKWRNFQMLTWSNAKWHRSPIIIAKVKSISHVRLFATPWTIAYHTLRPWDFPGRSTEVGCHFLLQRIFLTQGSNLGFPHCRQTLYRLSHQGRVTCGPQAPLSMGYPRQKYWSGLPFPSPGDLPDSGIQPMSLTLAGGFFTTEPLGSPQSTYK